MLELVDSHIHLDLFDDPEAVAGCLAELGIGAFAVTVTPRNYEQLSSLVAKPNVRLGVGLHPWYFERELAEEAVEQVVARIHETRFIGEIGLDFLEKHAPQTTWQAQRNAFQRMCTEAAGASQPDAPHILSIHAVRAATEVLDVLERTDAASRCTCIMHWFSGSTEELWRAIRMGCWFSINEMQATTKRSKEQLKLIPEDRLLLETDFPPHETQATPLEWAHRVRTSLETAAEKIASIRSTEATEIQGLTTENACKLLGL